MNIWLQLGGTVEADAKEMKKILNGDALALLKAINENGFSVNGETYISGDSVTTFCEENKWKRTTSKNGCANPEDVEFHLGGDNKVLNFSHGKDLIRITNLKGSVCDVQLAKSKSEKEMVSAALLGLMDQDKEFADLLMQYVSHYIFQRKDLKDINQTAMRQGKIKMKN